LSWRFNTQQRLAGACLACLLSAVGPATAASDHSSGDGSGASNERLRPNVYPAEPVLPSGAVPAEPSFPFFAVDWATTLRGTYTNSTDEETSDIRFVPSFVLEHEGSRSQLGGSGEIELSRPSDTQEVDVSGLRLNLEGGYALDSVTALTGVADLSFTQEPASTPGIANTIAQPAATLVGSIEGGATRQFGRFNIGVTGAVARYLYGPTELVDGTVEDNDEDNYWTLDGGLRLGFQVTPIFEVFGEGTLGRDLFARQSGVPRRDATDSSASVGVVARWNETLEASASTGLALRRFDDETLEEVTAQLFEAAVTYRPDSTWRLTGTLATDVQPSGPDNSGSTRVQYSADADLGYTVNSWLALRALAGWHTARFEGSAETETGYGLGAGADYRVNAHTLVSADYGYARTDNSANGLDRGHQLSLGVTLRR